MMNNTFYLRDALGPKANMNDADGIRKDNFSIEGSWFVDKVNKLFESEKGKYLGQWEALNTHLTSVEHDELEYAKNETILSLDSGRLIKSRFSGFNEGTFLKISATASFSKDVVNSPCPKIPLPPSHLIVRFRKDLRRA